MTIPMSQTNVSGLGVESAVFFDEMTRRGKMTGSRSGDAADRAAVPAVEYLQSQRLRMMMMTELAAATADVDVYLVASNAGGGGGGRGRGGDPADPAADPTTAAAGAAGAAGGSEAARLDAARRRARTRSRRAGTAARVPRSATSTMANLACYPAINIPNGFTDGWHPDQRDVLRAAVRRNGAARAREGVSGRRGIHLKQPTKLDT